MNKQEKSLCKFIEPAELDIWKKYHKCGCGKYTRCRVDFVALHKGTKKEHKLGILLKAIEHIANDKHFITEAVPNDRKARRIDFVSLTEGGTEYEFETNPKIRKEGATTIFVNEETVKVIKALVNMIWKDVKTDGK